MWQIVSFIVLGFLGGFTAVLTPAKEWSDLQSFAAFKRYVLGIIIGGLYYLLYSEYNYPNMIMAWVSGFAGTDFINRLIERRQPTPLAPPA